MRIEEAKNRRAWGAIPSATLRDASSAHWLGLDLGLGRNRDGFRLYAIDFAAVLEDCIAS